ncbi:MAG: fumarate hydratase [Endomicrobiales bacterium]|nr:fumarate hydratase [Endomicrobiales bacterium]
MREIQASKITETVARLCRHANYFLPEDVWRLIDSAYQNEKNPNARQILGQILENARAASKESALCQDTGIAEVFVRLGRDARVQGDLPAAVNEGVREGYSKGYLRNSVVSDPLERKNTGDNTPAYITTDIVPGDRIEITVMPKGGGTENASAVKMLVPAEGWEGVKNFVVETVKAKGVGACPPLIIGVGIGGSFNTVASLAKKAVLRGAGKPSQDASYASKEKELLDIINSTGIGPMGLCGGTTALWVAIEAAPCHIASLPAAVSVMCHSTRMKTEVI